VTIYPTLVQGVDAPPAIKKALEAAYEDASQGNIEVILLVRGGGSIEDLWAFNDESLARMIAKSPVPIISGVGHETDFTIADFVADLRAPTPTGAAELATPDRQALLQDLEVLAQRMTVRATQRLDREAQRLDQLSLRLSHALPNPDRMRDKAAQLKARLDQSWQVRVNAYQQQHLSWNSHLELLNPQRTLDRGYAVILDSNEQALRDPALLKAGELLSIHLAKGVSQVELAKVSSLAKNASNE
jgi:exodeoxyribonuclease VII large subunit